MCKASHVRSTFGSWDVEKSARRCGPKRILKSNVQNTLRSEQLWQLRCWKVHGANRFWSQKVQSTLRSEQLWQLRSLWCEAHFEVKMLKAPDVRTTSGLWDVEKVHAVVARSYTALRYTLRYTTSLHFTTLHYTTLLCTTLHYPTLHLQLQLRVQLHLQLRVQLQLQPRITRFQLHYTTPDDTALQLELQLQLHL